MAAVNPQQVDALACQNIDPLYFFIRHVSHECLGRQGFPGKRQVRFHSHYTGRHRRKMMEPFVR